MQERRVQRVQRAQRVGAVPENVRPGLGLEMGIEASWVDKVEECFREREQCEQGPGGVP